MKISAKRKVLTIGLLPEDFEFTKFGGVDEIKTTIKDELLKTFEEDNLSGKFKGIAITLHWKYFLVDGKPIEKLFHLMTINQVINIMDRLFFNFKPIFDINVPYLWGSQQDKKVSNQNIVNELYLISNKVHSYNTVLPHSVKPFSKSKTFNGYLTPSRNWVQEVMNEIHDKKKTLFVFPDTSAFTRYKSLFSNYKLEDLTYIVMSKKRDINTGKLSEDMEVVSELTGPKCNCNKMDTNKIMEVVMLDDLIMAGGTFRIAKEYLESLHKFPVAKWIIAAPQITWQTIGKVFESGFDKVVTIDNNYPFEKDVPWNTGLNSGLRLIPWDDIYEPRGICVRGEKLSDICAYCQIPLITGPVVISRYQDKETRFCTMKHANKDRWDR